MAILEASDVMERVVTIPADDRLDLCKVANICTVQLLDSDGSISYERLCHLLEECYKRGRTAEAKMHRQFWLGDMKDIERVSIIRALCASDYNIQNAARMLNIGKTTIYRKIEEYRIDCGQKEQ